MRTSLLAGLIVLFGFSSLARAQEPAPTAAPKVEAPSPTPSGTPEPPPATPSPEEVLQGLTEAQIKTALEAIKSNYLDASATGEQELQRAILQGLLQRLETGLVLESTAGSGESAPGADFLAEILDGKVGYLRLGTLNKATVAQVDAALKGFADKNLEALVLDLRGGNHSSDFEAAADIARWFCPKGKLLFTLQKPIAKQERIYTSNSDPRFTKLLVVLMDAETSGAGEALAATLRQNARAMLVGETTKGEAVEFADFDLGNGARIRVAVAQISLQELGSIYPRGVGPDIEVKLAPQLRDRIFEESKTAGISSLIYDPERPRMNEAALIANMNPEINGSRGGADKNRLRDPVLQRAVDLVTAIGFYQTRSNAPSEPTKSSPSR